jgi:hypothetical protein
MHGDFHVDVVGIPSAQVRPEPRQRLEDVGMLAFGETGTHMYCARIEFVLSLVVGFAHLASSPTLAPSTVDPFGDGVCRNPEE